MTRPAAYRRRLGFTLIELLVVLVIIAILLGLLLPAINGAIRKARGAAVQAEISQLAQALGSFRTKYGDYPPSRIIINEGGYVNTTDTTSIGAISGAALDVSRGQLYQRTVTAFRKFWPRVVLTQGSASTSTTFWYDFNGNGANDGGGASPVEFYLQGNECLVFFLGGIPLPGAVNPQGMTGFGKNPANPFFNSIPPTATSTSPMYSANRNPPFFDFDNSRLRYSASGHGMAAYVDSLNPANPQVPGIFAYFSTNNGTGYDPNDENVNNTLFPSEGDTLNSTFPNPVTLSFLSSQPLVGGTAPFVTGSPSPNPYTSGFPAGSISNVTYQNSQSFQIVSAGVDGVFGVGGYYNSSAPGGSALLREDSGVGSSNTLSNSTDPSLRTLERDNLTNFHNGKLE